MTVEEERAKELDKAGERIQAQGGVYGGARPASLAWLLTFLQENAATYSFGELANRWWEVLRFCRDGGLGTKDASLSNIRTVARRLPGRLAGSADDIRLYPGPMDRDWLQTLQGCWCTGLKIYIAGDDLSTGDIPINFKVRKGVVGIAAKVPNDDAGFSYQLIHLFRDLGERIRQCRYCQRVFLAGRTDKEFCTGTSCQALQYKIEHPEKRTVTKGKTKGGKHHGAKR